MFLSLFIYPLPHRNWKLYTKKSHLKKEKSKEKTAAWKENTEFIVLSYDMRRLVYADYRFKYY